MLPPGVLSRETWIAAIFWRGLWSRDRCIRSSAIGAKGRYRVSVFPGQKTGERCCQMRRPLVCCQKVRAACSFSAAMLSASALEPWPLLRVYVTKIISGISSLGFSSASIAKR